MSDTLTREIALNIISETWCEGSAGTHATIGGGVAERIMKNLEAGGFNFAQPVEDEHPHRRKRA